MKSTDLDKKRWGVLIASSLINLCIGSIYAWSVFAGPLAAKLTGLLGTTFTAADLAVVFTGQQHRPDNHDCRRIRD